MQQVSFNDMYGSKFLSASDLGNREVAATISDVTTDILTDRQTGQSRTRVILGFTGKAKKLVVNKTNANALKKGCGTEDFNAWVGAKVVLYTADTSMGEGVRIRMAPKPAAEEMSDEMPF
jgi:hypothetical protein